jgi:hypothetical protein
MAIKVNKRKVMDKLRATIESKRKEKELLTMGLFTPTQHDVEDELERLTSYRYQSFRSNLSPDAEV